MGYNLEFRFDPAEVYDKQILLSRSVAAGAELQADGDDHPDAMIVLFGQDLFPNESATVIADGRWVWSRALRDPLLLDRFLQFAERVGCKLMDSQQDIQLTNATISQVLHCRDKFNQMIGGLFGAVRVNKDTDGDEAS